MQLAQRLGQSRRIRRPHQDGLVTQLGERAAGDEPSPVDHHHVVDEELDLTEQVARHEHGAAGRRPITQQIA